MQSESVQFEDGVAHHFQEEPVVGDHQQGGLGPGEKSFQPFDHAEVEVVGGLVEQEEVRLFDEAFGEGDPALLAAAQLVDEPVRVVQAQFSEDFLGLRLVAPGVSPVHGIVGRLKGFGIVALCGVLVLADGAHGVVVGLEEVGKDGAVEVEAVVLGEVGHPGLAVEGDGAPVGALDAEEDLHQGALARAVPGHERGLLALIEAEVQVLEDEPFAEPLRQPFYRKHVSACHGAKVEAERR